MEGFVVGRRVPLGEGGGESTMIVIVERLRLAQDGHPVVQFVGDIVAGSNPDPSRTGFGMVTCPFADMRPATGSSSLPLLVESKAMQAACPVRFAPWQGADAGLDQARLSATDWLGDWKAEKTPQQVRAAMQRGVAVPVCRNQRYTTSDGPGSSGNWRASRTRAEAILPISKPRRLGEQSAIPACGSLWWTAATARSTKWRAFRVTRQRPCSAAKRALAAL